MKELNTALNKRVETCHEKLISLRPRRLETDRTKFFKDYDRLLYHSSLLMMLNTLKRSLDDQECWPEELASAWEMVSAKFSNISKESILECDDPKLIEQFLFELWSEYATEETLSLVDPIEIIKTSISMLDDESFDILRTNLNKSGPETLVTILLNQLTPFKNLQEMKESLL